MTTPPHPLPPRLAAANPAVVVERFHSRDPKTGEVKFDPIVQSMGETILGAAGIAKKAAAKRAEIFAEGRGTVPGQHLRARRETFAIVKPALEALREAGDKSLKVMARIEGHINTPRAEPQNAAEIRAALRITPADAREALLKEAVKEGDPVIDAVLSSPAFLSGMPRSEQNMLRLQWQRKIFAAELDRIDRLRGATMQLEFVFRELEGWLDEATDKHLAAAAEQDAAA